MSQHLYTGGTIVVSAFSGGSARTSDAVAVVDGRVAALGDEARELSQRSAVPFDTHDLAGGTLVPGLGDGHAHPVLGGLEFAGPRVRAARNLDELIQIVADWRREHPDDAWIVGASYDATFAPGGEFDARWLDAVTGDVPTVLRAWDYHTVWVNSAALRAGGITASTPDPPLGRIVRRDDGSPLGTLQEAAANQFLASVVPAFSLERRVEAIERATGIYAAQGTTWVQDAWVELRDIDTYLNAARQNRLHTRVNLAFRADPHTWQEQLPRFLAAQAEIRELAHPRLTANTVKFFVDGVIENHTAALIEPYADRPDDSGLPNWQPDALAQATATFAEAGFQLHLHAIGDGANRAALDALELVAQNPRIAAPVPHVIAHVALLAPSDVERFARAGVIANFEPYWAQCDAVMRDLTIPHIGEDREAQQYLIASVLRSGAGVSFGSDWPVTTQDWRPAFATAITRSSLESGATPWLPDERITAVDALGGYTSGIARQALLPDLGTLEVGSEFDAAWLSANPLEVEPSEVPHIEVRGTWVAGERVA